MLGQHWPDAGRQKLQSTSLPSAEDVLWMMFLEGDAVISLQRTISVWPLEACWKLSGLLRAYADRVKD